MCIIAYTDITSFCSCVSLHTQILHLFAHVYHCIHRYYIFFAHGYHCIHRYYIYLLMCIIAYTDIASFCSCVSLHTQILHLFAHVYRCIHRYYMIKLCRWLLHCSLRVIKLRPTFKVCNISYLRVLFHSS
jgi:hypothetical protein